MMTTMFQYIQSLSEEQYRINFAASGTKRSCSHTINDLRLQLTFFSEIVFRSAHASLKLILIGQIEFASFPREMPVLG